MTKTTKQEEPSKLKPLRVGIICNDTNREDLLHYREELVNINKQFGSNVKLILFGFNGINDGGNWLTDVDFEFVKPTTIINYHKQLKALNLDLVFIPLIRSIYNATSENYNKYLEAGLFKIPVLTINIYPYNTLIVDKKNGFLYKEEKDLIPYLSHLNNQRALITSVGLQAYKIVTEEYNYSIENIKIISDLFVLKG